MSYLLYMVIAFILGFFLNMVSWVEKYSKKIWSSKVDVNFLMWSLIYVTLFIFNIAIFSITAISSNLNGNDMIYSYLSGLGIGSLFFRVRNWLKSKAE